MSPGLLITRFDATLLGMAVCLLAGAVAGVLSALPTALAALALGVTVSEL